MLQIIGVSHHAQVRKQGCSETRAQKQFAECLRASVSDLQPAFIAEEYSEEVLARLSEDSIAREIALENGIAHKFCDPTCRERSAIGYKGCGEIFLDLWRFNNDVLPEKELKLKAEAIEIGRYFPKREKFWLCRLNECPGRDGIFICGDGHVESFTSLLNTKQIDWTIIARRMGFTPDEDAQFQRAALYLRAHPELAGWDE
jgi:hypothetical protein